MEEMDEAFGADVLIGLRSFDGLAGWGGIFAVWTGG